MLNVFIIAVAIVSAVADNFLLPPEKCQRLTDEVNSARTTWTAEPFTEQMYESTTSTCAKIVNSGHEKEILAFIEKQGFSRTGEIPINFDAREKWPECPSIRHIYNQGRCGACWAVSTVSAFTDRICIKSKGTKTALRSVQQVLSCSKKKFGPEDGCNGGSTMLAMKYLVSNGVVTGGDFTSARFTNKDGCQPWLVQPCTISKHNKRISRCYQVDKRPAAGCWGDCYNEKYTTMFRNDIIKAKKIIKKYKSVLNVQREIIKNGPVVTWFTCYEDIFMYKSGVYQHITGEQMPDHSVRVLGWGVENGVPYWLAAGSYDEYWGDKGFFKIIRGKNHLGFEENIAAALVRDL